MTRLHLFGDSYTQGHLLDTTFPPYKEWREYRGTDLPLPWSDILSIKLNMNVLNNAVAGMSNPEIFNTICEKSHEFGFGDIVIVNWTFNHRFRWVTWDDDLFEYRWRRFSLSKTDGRYIDENVREAIASNRIHQIQIDEIYSYQKLLLEYASVKKFHLFFWSADVDIINCLPNKELLNDKYILNDEIVKIPPLNIHHDKVRTLFDVIKKHGGKTIEEETNFTIHDGGHMGESGHQVQANLFYDYITNYLKINTKQII